jgi:GTP-binding protein EngB required for normal cell division
VLQNSQYLRLRGKNLKRVLLVVDARHGLKRTDFACLNSLMSGMAEEVDETAADDPTVEFDVTFDKSRKSASTATWKLQVVLTKCDLVERAMLARRIAAVREQVRANFYDSELPVMMVSSIARLGVVELQKELSALVPSESVV